MYTLLFHLQYKHSATFANRLNELENVRTHSGNSIENATPLSGTKYSLLLDNLSAMFPFVYVLSHSCPLSCRMRHNHDMSFLSAWVGQAVQALEIFSSGSQAYVGGRYFAENAQALGEEVHRVCTSHQSGYTPFS